ncbi:MAG: SpoIIE family protein phosphatase [Myxococcales bacterium]|nr:SpoIIE family protein phosphatase [Myxococcales bacterium]
MASIIIHGAQPFGRFPIVKLETSIGRGEECDIFFPDRHLSRLHAEIRQEGQGQPFVLVDLRSKNGTFLNGVRLVRATALEDGDVIDVGRNRLTFVAGLEREEGEPRRPSSHDFSLRDLVERKTADIADTSGHDRIVDLINLAPEALSGYESEGALCDRVLDLLVEQVGLEHGAVLVWNASASAFDVRAGRGRFSELGRVVLGEAILERAVQEGGAFLYALGEAEDTADSEAGCCMPLLESAMKGKGTQVRGLIYAEMSLLRRLAPSNLNGLSAFANVVAMRLENLQLHEARRDGERLEKDLRLAAEIQASLLPGKAPDLSGYEIAGGTEPCRMVGGDYYDFVREDRALTFALGDVAGNGLGAAMLMIALRAAVTAHWRNRSLAEAMLKMNETFGPNVPDDRYATLFFARLDLDTGVVTYVNAAQNPPLLVRSADDTVETLKTGGTILGAFPETRYDEDTVKMQPGDVLLVFSDGVSDVWPSDDVAERALLDVLKRHRARSAETIKTFIFDTIHARNASRPKDDRTILVIKRALAPALG